MAPDKAIQTWKRGLEPSKCMATEVVNLANGAIVTDRPCTGWFGDWDRCAGGSPRIACRARLDHGSSPNVVTKYFTAEIDSFA